MQQFVCEVRNDWKMVLLTGEFVFYSPIYIQTFRLSSLKIKYFWVQKWADANFKSPRDTGSVSQYPNQRAGLSVCPWPPACQRPSTPQSPLCFFLPPRPLISLWTPLSIPADPLHSQLHSSAHLLRRGPACRDHGPAPWVQGCSCREGTAHALLTKSTFPVPELL